MKDFFGQELTIGDWVAFTRPNYRDLVVGRIISFTPKKVHVSYFQYGARTLADYLSEPEFLIKDPRKQNIKEGPEGPSELVS